MRQGEGFGVVDMGERSPWESAPLIAHDAVFIADAHFKSDEISESALNSRLDSEISSASIDSLRLDSQAASSALLSTFRQMSQAPATQLPSQMFLMGDIAHVLVGALNPSIEANAPLLEALRELEGKTQIWWFEGNHDFALAPLQRLLPKVHFIPRTRQPMAFLLPLDSESDSQAKSESNSESASESSSQSCSESSQKSRSESTQPPRHKPLRLLLAHGDLFLSAKYEGYIRTLTSKAGIFSLKILNYVTFGNLYRFLAKKINKKLIKEGRIDFEPFAKGRVERYAEFFHAAYSQTHTEAVTPKEQAFDGIIEGHFHLGKMTRQNQILYISLPSFYVTRSIFTIKSALLNTK